MSLRALRAENQSLQRELRAANRSIERLTESNENRARELERRDAEIAHLITVHHTEKMFLLNNLEARMSDLVRLHRELVGQLNTQENCVPKDPAEVDKVHGFALTINPLQEEGAHEIKFIAGQEMYTTREAAGTAGMLFGFTETGNPIDLRQNVMREANARLRARLICVRIRDAPLVDARTLPGTGTLPPVAQALPAKANESPKSPELLPPLLDVRLLHRGLAVVRHRGIISAAAHTSCRFRPCHNHVHRWVMLTASLYVGRIHHLAVRESHHLSALLLRVYGEGRDLLALDHAAFEAWGLTVKPSWTSAASRPDTIIYLLDCVHDPDSFSPSYSTATPSHAQSWALRRKKTSATDPLAVDTLSLSLKFVTQPSLGDAQTITSA